MDVSYGFDIHCSLGGIQRDKIPTLDPRNVKPKNIKDSSSSFLVNFGSLLALCYQGKGEACCASKNKEQG